MTYEDVQKILGQGPVRSVEEAVNEALIASRIAVSEGGAEALELLLTSQLAAVIITQLSHMDARVSAERASKWLHILVEEALEIRENASKTRAWDCSTEMETEFSRIN